MADDVTQVGGGVSGFVTDDGKDLSEVFLGREEKAVSAGTADSASSAETVSVTAFKFPVLASPSVEVQLKATTWTAPSDGIFLVNSISWQKYGNSLTIAGIKYSIASTYGTAVAVPFVFCILKGQTISITGYHDDLRSTLNGRFCPHVFTEVENNE